MCSEKTPDDGQRNCPKHVDFYSKNKFEKLVHLVGFIIRKYHGHLQVVPDSFSTIEKWSEALGQCRSMNCK